MPPLAALHWSLQTLWPLGLLPFALGAAILGYRRTTPPLTSAQRLPLVALRTLAYTLLILVLASPVLTRLRHSGEAPRIAVLVDESASMSSVDVPGGPNRTQRAHTALAVLRDALQGTDVQLEVIPFAAGVGTPTTPTAYLEGSVPARGAGTDLLGALSSTANRLGGENLQGMVVLSDGRPTQGEFDASGVAGLGRPVFTVGIGDTLPPADVAIGRCDYSPFAYLESESVIEVRLESVGFRGRSTNLRLLQGDRELFRRRIQFDQDRGRMSEEIPLRLTTPGRQRFQVRVDSLPGEFTTRNNAREISIEVLKNRLRVLVLAARPDWDVAFFARTLRADPNVEVRVAHRDVAGNWLDSDKGTRWDLPRGTAWQRDFDLYVLGSTGAELTGVASDLVAAVQSGKGLLVLAGRADALGQPAVAAALGLALPVTQARGLRYDAVRGVLTPQGRNHPITQGWADVAGAAGELDVLPPVLGQHEAVTPRPGALTLLATNANPPRPLLVVGQCGEGQTAVINGFPMWRWASTDREPVRQAATAFVAALVRWLTQPRDLQPVQIATGKPVYESGEAVEFVGHVLDAQLAPLADATVQVEVHALQDGGGAVATTPLEGRAGHAGEYGARLPGLGPGEYEARATATRGGKSLGQASTRFTVDAYSAEFADPSQDAPFLREIASRTGGRYANDSEVAALARLLPRERRTTVLRSEVEVWDTAPFFIGLIAALGLEWLLRKRHGLL